MKKILFFLLITLSITSLSVNPVYSQSSVSNKIESCFQYYDYGKVKVNLLSNKGTYNPGEKIKLQGTIVNENSFPLIDIVLYALLRRENSDDQLQMQNGHFLIDRIKLKENLNFLPNEEKYIETEITIPSTYPAGNYIIHYYIFSKEGFHYSGRSFLEDDMAGSATFSINNNIPLVYFDINNLKVNGNNENIKEFSKTYNTSTFNFEIPIIDQRTTKTNLDVKVRYFYFEDDLDELLESSKDLIIRPDDPALRTNLSLPADLNAAYVILAEIDKPVKTIFKYRFVKNGTRTKELRINDLGITDYPLIDTSKAYICFHSPASVASPETEINLSILDSQKNTVDSKSVKSAFSSQVLAFSLPFDKLATKNDFYLKADLINAKGTKYLLRHYADGLFSKTINNIEIGYDIGSPGQIMLIPKDIAGNKISSDGYIESIRIKDDKGNILQEDYIIRDFNKPFNLGDLPKGKYTVEAEVGEIKATKDFELGNDLVGNTGDGFVYKNIIADKVTQENKSKQKNMTTVVLFIIATATLLVTGGYFILRKLKSNNPENTNI